MSLSIRTSQTLDIDSADALKVINSAFDNARDHQQPRLEQYQRNYHLFNGFIDMTTRDPDRSNVFIPKIRQIIRTKVPRSVKALSGTRPYIPFDSRRPEFSEGVRVWVDYIDNLLEDGYWMPQLTFADLMAHVYGIGYIDFTPIWEPVSKPMITKTEFGPQFSTMETMNLSLQVKAWAPWEVYPDPFATGLEKKGQCRYLVKLQLASRREIYKMATERGAYPGLDIEQLMSDRTKSGIGTATTHGDHPGLKLLRSIGLNNPRFDPDIGVLMRFESDDRYIDAWNGEVLLRDGGNPYPCKQIHTARIVHGLDPHTQNQFFGTGDVAPNEVLQELLNDMYDQAVNSWNMMDQPVTYYDKAAHKGPANQLVRTMGNKIGLTVPSDRRIQDVVLESYGHELPASHFNMLKLVQDYMDMGAQQDDINRGEVTDDGATATEIALASERGDSTQELDVRLCEHITLRSFGKKVIETVCASAPIADIIEQVGLQRATQALFMNPMGVPGGINMTFKGSDRVQNMAMRQRQWLQLSGELQKLGSTRPDLLSKKLLEVFDEDSPDTLEMIIPLEIQMLLAQQKEQQAFERDKEMKQLPQKTDTRSAAGQTAGAIRQQARAN